MCKWLGDAQAAAETLLARFDMAAANSKWLDDVAHAGGWFDAAVYNAGDFPSLAPNYDTPQQRHACPPRCKILSRGVCATVCPPKPAATPPGGTVPLAWSSAFVLVWDWTWRRYADLPLAEKHYKRALLFVDLIANSTEPHTHVINADFAGKPGGGGSLGDWCAASGTNGTTAGHGKNSVPGSHHSSGVQNTFYLARTTEAVLRAARALSRPRAELKRLEKRVQLTKSGMNFRYYNHTAGEFGDPWIRSAANVSKYGAESLQTACSLGLALGSAALPEFAKQNATAKVQASLLRDVVQAQGNRMTTGLIGTKYLLPSLAENPSEKGVNAALAVLTQREQPSWLFMVDQVCLRVL